MKQNVLQDLLENTYVELKATLSDVSKGTGIHVKRLKVIFANPEVMTRAECQKLEQFFKLEEGALYVGTDVDIRKLVIRPEQNNEGGAV